MQALEAWRRQGLPWLRQEPGSGIFLAHVPPPHGPPHQEIPLRSNVYEVYATDNDEGLNGAVRYSFLKTTGNRDWEYFTIDPISGLIQTAQRLDREKQAVYSVRGQAWGEAVWISPALPLGGMFHSASLGP